jgi:hypothetical protein
MSAERSGGGGGNGNGGRGKNNGGWGRPQFGGRAILNDGSDNSDEDLFIGTPNSSSGGGGGRGGYARPSSSGGGGRSGGGGGGGGRRREEASPEVTAGWGGKPWRAWGGKTPGGDSDMSSEWATPWSRRDHDHDAYDEQQYPEEDYMYPDTPASERSRVPARPLRTPAAAAAYNQAVAAANAAKASAGDGGLAARAHSQLSRVSRGLAASPAAVAAAAVAAASDSKLIEMLESQHSASVGQIQALQTTLDVRSVQLSESKGALKEVQHRLVGALAAVGDDLEAVEDVAGASGDGVVGRAAEVGLCIS